MSKKLKLNKITITHLVSNAEKARVLGGATVGICEFPTRYNTCDGVQAGCLATEFSCNLITCTPSCQYCYPTVGCSDECNSDAPVAC